MRITVVGDTLLDEDLDGTSTRHSPDAPVPVIDAETSSFRAGGGGQGVAGSNPVSPTTSTIETPLLREGRRRVGGRRYRRRMARARSFSDAQLASAIAASSSWRGTLRSLGLASGSAAAIRSVRAHAEILGLDVAHFRGQRRWTDRELQRAVQSAGSWPGVLDRLGVPLPLLAAAKGHAARMSLDVEHLSEEPAPTEAHLPDLAHLSRAGAHLAAAWFALCGHRVSWPLEPCRYDLLVDVGAQLRRVQVKTTVTRAGASWKVYLSTSSGRRAPYAPDEIDDFFVIDGDLRFYLIPLPAVGGLHALHLSAYEAYVVPALPRARTPPPTAPA